MADIKYSYNYDFLLPLDRLKDFVKVWKVKKKGSKMETYNRDIAAFWDLADQTKTVEKYHIDQDLQFLQVAPLEVLKKIFLQYRFFTHFYITDLAILISKLPLGEMRSILADILNEELGSGKAHLAHPNLYDDFLLSLGIPKQHLLNANKDCIKYLVTIQHSLQTQSWAYGLGLRGMGGECLCQIYLATMHEYFSKNPAIKKQKHIAWLFWDIHIGEVDLHHQKIMRQAINNLFNEYPDTVNDLTRGYLESKNSWDIFWKQIFKAARIEENNHANVN